MGTNTPPYRPFNQALANPRTIIYQNIEYIDLSYIATLSKHRHWPSTESFALGRIIDRSGLPPYLHGSYLRRVNLSNKNLSGAILTDTILSEGDLSGSNLTGANLRNAILIDVDLSNATLSGTILSNANLCGANLRDVKGELGLTSLQICQVGTKGGMPQDSVEQAEKLFKDYFWKQWAEHTQKP